jgi:hypothetical protein
VQCWLRQRLAPQLMMQPAACCRRLLLPLLLPLCFS